MTSNQSLQSKLPSKKDFKVSLLSVVIPAIISFIAAMILFVFSPLNFLYNSGGMSYIKEEYRLLLTASEDGMVFGAVFAILGMLFAVFSFKFKMKKKTVNVYYSLPVSRKTLFTNRVIASIIGIAVSLVIPILIDAVLNITCFGHTGYIIGCALTLYAECFAFEFVGFVLMSIAAAVCHTFVETILFGVGLTALPSVLFYSVNNFFVHFLKGYNGNTFSYYNDISLFADSDLISRFAFLNPIFFSKRMDAESPIYDNFFSFLYQYSGYNAYDSSDMTETLHQALPYEAIGIEFIIPILIWLAVSVCLLFAAKYLFVKSKSENAGIHASVPFVNAFFAAEVGLVVLNLWMAYAYVPVFSNAVMYVIGLVLMILTYFAVLFISKRTVKIKPSALVCGGVTSAATVVLFIVLITGGFGYSSYVPDAEKVEWATLTYADMDMSGSETPALMGVSELFVDSYNESPLGYFSSEEDIENIIKINERIVCSDDKDGMGISVFYRFKNGKSVKRYYSSVDLESQKMILSLTDSQVFKDELTYLLSDAEKKDAPVTNAFDDDNLDASIFFSDTDEKQLKNLFENGFISVTDFGDYYEEKTIKNTPELRQALLKDLLSRNYEQRFMSSEKAIGAISFLSYYYDEEQDRDYDIPYYGITPNFYLYDSMENTVNYLKSTGEYAYFKTDITDSIDSVSVEKVSNIIATQKDDYDYYVNMTRLFCTDYYISDEYDAEMYVDDYFDVYADAPSFYFKNAISVTDKEQIAQLVDAASYFGLTEDDDYIVCVNYSDGLKRTMLLRSQYAPEYIK